MRIRYYIAESEINPATADTGLLWYLVLPVGLNTCTHHKQAAIAQITGEFLHLFMAMLQFKAPGCTQTQRRDHRILSQFTLVITMPGHTVLAVTVVIDEHGIEAGARNAFNSVFQTRQHRSPGQGIESKAGIPVAAVFFTVPGLQSWDKNGLAAEIQVILFPGRIDFQGFKTKLRVTGVQKCRIKQDVTILQSQFFHRAVGIVQRKGDLHGQEWMGNFREYVTAGANREESPAP